MTRSQRKYDHEYKVQAVNLAKEIGGEKAAKELGIPEGTIHTWLKNEMMGNHIQWCLSNRQLRFLHQAPLEFPLLRLLVVFPQVRSFLQETPIGP